MKTKPTKRTRRQLGIMFSGAATGHDVSGEVSDYARRVWRKMFMVGSLRKKAK